MERRFNLLAGAASLLSLLIVAIPFLYKGNNSSDVQSFVAFLILVLLAGLFVWMKKYDVYMRSEIRKEELIKVSRQHIESATKKIILFSNDLSWANDYADAIRGRIISSCEVIVVHKKSSDKKVIENAEILRLIGVKIVELEEDHLLRATLVDPDDLSMLSYLLRIRRESLGRQFLCRPESPGQTKIFITSVPSIKTEPIPF